MSVKNDIQQTWDAAILKAIKKHHVDYSEMKQIAIENTSGNEYLIDKGSEDKKTFIVSHPCGIRCRVFKRGFRTKYIAKETPLKDIKSPFK